MKPIYLLLLLYEQRNYGPFVPKHVVYCKQYIVLQ